ncbi:hypothetical protein O181_044300 [Austropuccinia psidii MF-1]|uniref:Uncharacterized protein n=1 Tax=Austropuccinia psidii MF-1 TaxID=1389203 RepID=A0A9Q3DJS8_9BASI|nr:hypothetical protein [Austropuccinia psidii MF-1]
MDQKSTSELPPLPEHTLEGQYAEGIEEEDKKVHIQSHRKKMKALLLTQRKKESKRSKQTYYTAIAIPSEPTLPRHVRSKDSPIPPTPDPREKSTPKTEKRSQIILNKLFFSPPDHPSSSQKEISKITSPTVKISAKEKLFLYHHTRHWKRKWNP